MNELLLYGDIGYDWWSNDGISEQVVAEGLKQLDPTAASHKIRINSPGGNVDTGLAILSLCRSHTAQMKAINPAFQLETVCDGYAMSSASVVFMSGDIRTISLGGIVMIHDAWSGCYGNAEEMAKMVTVLDKLSQNAANIYATLATPAEKDQPARNSAFFRALMKEETYFIGDEAIACGIATRQDVSVSASLFSELSPEKMKGRYVSLMTQHYQKRTYTKATAAASVINSRLAAQRLALMAATFCS
jgi:ATP-dependent protease ClpP protease subunit